jgi:hypothetical protein
VVFPVYPKENYNEKVLTVLSGGDSIMVKQLITNCEFKGWNHRHLSNIDRLTVHSACLVCFSSSVNGRSKRKRKRKEA